MRRWRCSGSGGRWIEGLAQGTVYFFPPAPAFDRTSLTAEKSKPSPALTPSTRLRRHDPRVEVEIDVAAGEHHHDGLALDVELRRRQSGQPDGAARLDHQLEMGRRIAHRLRGLLVGDGNRAGERVAVDLEGDGAWLVDQQRIA